MDRRLILGLTIAAIVGALGIAALGGMFGPARFIPTPSPAVVAPSATVPGSPAAAASPSCAVSRALLAERAKAADTGFPVPVEWLGIGPADEVHFTQSDVSPRIPIDPLGPASITVALQYIDGAGDRYKLTGGSVALAYDPATGRLSGQLDTGYGKNSNRATTDTVPSKFDGTYARQTNPAGGVLEGSITHPDRATYRFKLMLSEQEFTIIPCVTTQQTDSP